MEQSTGLDLFQRGLGRCACEDKQIFSDSEGMNDEGKNETRLRSVRSDTIVWKGRILQFHLSK